MRFNRSLTKEPRHNNSVKKVCPTKVAEMPNVHKPKPRNLDTEGHISNIAQMDDRPIGKAIINT